MLWVEWELKTWMQGRRSIDDYYKWILKELAVVGGFNLYNCFFFVKLAHLAKIRNIYKYLKPPPRWRCYKILEPPICKALVKSLGQSIGVLCFPENCGEVQWRHNFKAIKTYLPIYIRISDRNFHPTKQTKYVWCSNCGRISNFQVGILGNLVKVQVLTSSMAFKGHQT